MTRALLTAGVGDFPFINEAEMNRFANMASVGGALVNAVWSFGRAKAPTSGVVV
jgi:hypothetical protein